MRKTYWGSRSFYQGSVAYLRVVCQAKNEVNIQYTLILSHINQKRHHVGNASFDAPAGGAGAENFYQKIPQNASGVEPPQTQFKSLEQEKMHKIVLL